ncbi:MAG: hypothetical protein OCD76_18975 [Reichenbachiella sp.]
MEEASLSFEQQWNEQFATTELAPPPHVWVAIDGQLAQGEADAYKNQANTYRWLAAACLALLMLFGWNYWSNDTSILSEPIQVANEPLEILETETNPKPINSLVQSNEKPIQEPSQSNQTNAIAIDELDNKTVEESLAPPNELKLLPTEEPDQPYFEVKSGSRSRIFNQAANKSSTQFLSYSHKGMLLPSIVDELISPDHLFGVPVIPNDDEVLANNNLWAGVIMSTGVFDPQLNVMAADEDMVMSDFEESITGEENFTNQQQVQSMNNSSSENVGQSKSGGINMGTKRKRLLLSSGLILNAYSSGKSNVAIAQTNEETFALSGNKNDEKLSHAVNSHDVQLTNQYTTLNNEFRYLTIPLQVGYALRDKAFYINLNSGLSTNFLLHAETVSSSDIQGISNDFDIREGYHAVYLDLMMSMQFGYVFAEKYQIMLEPNYKRAITDFSKTSYNDQRKPNNLGIAIGLKYNF